MQIICALWQTDQNVTLKSIFNVESEFGGLNPEKCHKKFFSRKCHQKVHIPIFTQNEVVLHASRLRFVAKWPKCHPRISFQRRIWILRSQHGKMSQKNFSQKCHQKVHIPILTQNDVVFYANRLRFVANWPKCHPKINFQRRIRIWRSQDGKMSQKIFFAKMSQKSASFPFWPKMMPFSMQTVGALWQTGQNVTLGSVFNVKSEFGGLNT